MIAITHTAFTPYRLMTAVLLLGYAVVILTGLPSYVDPFSLNTILGIVAIVFTWKGGAAGKRWLGYLLFAAALMMIYTRIPSKFFLYITIGMAMFSILESVAGKAGPYAALSLILMSPLCEYFTNVFGFPIRLQLTQLAGRILNIVDGGYSITGNSLRKGLTEFTVDTACMGLHMLVSSLLTGMILLGIFQRQLEKKLSAIYLLMIGGIIFMLNLFSNLIRIIVLVELNVPPENNMHSSIGLICFITYVLIPSVFLLKWFVFRFGKLPFPKTENDGENPVIFWIQIPLLVIISLTVLGNGNRSMNRYIEVGNVTTSDYQVEKLPDAIVKLTAPHGLVYLKPIMGFYSSDHQPTMCWKGSGYEFKRLETRNLDGQTFYTSCLEKDKEKLYTAWWYDNGALQTISQFTWRWESFKSNKPWALVNVTANSPDELISQIRKIKRINPCRMLLNPINDH